MPNSEPNNSGEWRSTRFWLAIGVTIISIVAVALLARIIIVRQNDAASAQNVLNSILPLLGTWVGTVLAYYFSKENFEAATRSVAEMARQITPQEKLRSTPAKDKMIPKTQMFFKTWESDKLNLVGVLNELEDAKKGNRIPILEQGTSPKYILHRSIVDQFLSDLARSPKVGVDVSTLTVQNMLDQRPGIKTIAESFGLINAESTLADAQDVMSRIPDCQDVFVTKTGNKNEEVLGWITNVIIQENARV